MRRLLVRWLLGCPGVQEEFRQHLVSELAELKREAAQAEDQSFSAMIQTLVAAREKQDALTQQAEARMAAFRERLNREG